MRKIVAAALAVGMAAMTVTGCSSPKSESKETTKATAEASKETQKETEKETQKDTEAISTEERLRKHLLRQTKQIQKRQNQMRQRANPPLIRRLYSRI